MLPERFDRFFQPFSTAISRHRQRVGVYCFDGVMGRTVMSRNSFWRAVAVSAQVAALIVAFGCESDIPSAPTAPPEASEPPHAPAFSGMGVLGGTVTINGQAFPLAWVE